MAPVERPGWRPFRLPGRAVGGWYAELVGRLLRYNNVSLQDMFTLNLQMVNQRFIGWIERNVAQDIMFSPELCAWLELTRDHIATAIGSFLCRFE